MSEFIYHIHHWAEFKMGKLDSLAGHFGEEKCGMDAHFFDEGQLLDFENDDVKEEDNAKDIEL